eukprot:Nk52_evm25s2449 gene=Nk52_evmTU25s2449
MNLITLTTFACTLSCMLFFPVDASASDTAVQGESVDDYIDGFKMLYDLDDSMSDDDWVTYNMFSTKYAKYPFDAKKGTVPKESDDSRASKFEMTIVYDWNSYQTSMSSAIDVQGSYFGVADVHSNTNFKSALSEDSLSVNARLLRTDENRHVYIPRKHRTYSTLKKYLTDDAIALIEDKNFPDFVKKYGTHLAVKKTRGCNVDLELTYNFKETIATKSFKTTLETGFSSGSFGVSTSTSLDTAARDAQEDMYLTYLLKDDSGSFEANLPFDPTKATTSDWAEAIDGQTGRDVCTAEAERLKALYMVPWSYILGDTFTDDAILNKAEQMTLMESLAMQNAMTTGYNSIYKTLSTRQPFAEQFVNAPYIGKICNSPSTIDEFKDIDITGPYGFDIESLLSSRQEISKKQWSDSTSDHDAAVKVTFFYRDMMSYYKKYIVTSHTIVPSMRITTENGIGSFGFDFVETPSSPNPKLICYDTIRDSFRENCAMPHPKAYPVEIPMHFGYQYPVGDHNREQGLLTVHNLVEHSPYKYEWAPTYCNHSPDRWSCKVSILGKTYSFKLELLSKTDFEGYFLPSCDINEFN